MCLDYNLTLQFPEFVFEATATMLYFRKHLLVCTKYINLMKRITFCLTCLLLTISSFAQITITSPCESIVSCLPFESCTTTIVNSALMATTDCSSSDVITYSYIIDLYNDGSIDADGTGNSIDYDYPQGVHQITMVASDACGETENCINLIDIQDCFAPTVMTYPGLGLNLNDGTYEITAASINNNSSDACGIDSFLIVIPSQGLGQSTPPVDAASSIILNCDNFGTNTFDLWAVDVNGNWGYTSSYISVDENDDACHPFGIYPIGFDWGDMFLGLDSLLVSIDPESTPGLPDFDYYQIHYSINPPPYYSYQNQYYPTPPPAYVNADWTLMPRRQVDAMSGVSTLDLVQIAQLILGIDEFNIYQHVAADFNNSGSISVLDIIDLRRLILGLLDDDEIEVAETILFFDLDSMPTPDNGLPLKLMEQQEYTNFSRADPNLFSLVPVKKGDIDLNESLGFTSNDPAEVRSDGEVYFHVPELNLQAGESYQVPVQLEAGEEVIGFQFKWRFDPNLLSIDSIIPANLSEFGSGNYNDNLLAEGELPMTWSHSQLQPAENDGPLFYLNISASANGYLSDVFWLDQSNPLLPEAYSPELMVSEARLQFNGAVSTVAPEKAISQVHNYPNPFYTSTAIHFHQATAGSVALRIFDSQGQLVHEQHDHYTQGYNKIKLNDEHLKQSGIYYFQLESPQGTYAQKMMKL